MRAKPHHCGAIMPRTYLMLLWHMHQPFYKDLAQGEYRMPWVRLHALKDYYGMAAMLRDFPSVHMTFNLVPSLLAQLEDYANERASESAMQAAFRPLEAMTDADRAALLESAFQVNYDHMLNRYPRLQELHEKVRSLGADAARQLFTPQDWLDLQVTSQIVWFDELYLENDPEVARLVQKGRGYNEDDKRLAYKKEIEILKATLEVYRELSLSGQIEISTSPFYHPILPLLCDSSVAEESHPGIALPRHRFRRPEDAREQLRRAKELHERLFGKPPRGLWPSEGSVSDEALAIAAEEGFEWAATDEGVLGRSLGIGFERETGGGVHNGRELYRPHRLSARDRSIALFFRDHQLSDLIGFVYSRMDPHAAAADLHGKIKAAAASAEGRPAVVSVILDGENAWEFFPQNGREFLRAFYGRVAGDPDLRAVTASEALGVVEPGELRHVVPGSWINANFDVWIGDAEDNRAWDLLWEARELFDHVEPASGAPDRARAFEEIGVAEGSDWCWWYGPEHSSPLDAEFDLLYRLHLSNAYRMLGAIPPDELAEPIKHPPARAAASPPRAQISPIVDGEVTSYFEWIGAGFYQPDERHGSMHGGRQSLEGVYYGYNATALFLRVDFHPDFFERFPKFDLRIAVQGEGRTRIHARFANGAVETLQLVRSEQVVASDDAGLKAALKRIFELQLDFSLVGLRPETRTRFQISLWANDLPLESVPREGWLDLDLTRDMVVW